MFELNGMTEMTEKDARETVGGSLIIVVCIVKDQAGNPATNDAAKVSMQDFHFVM